MITVRQSWSWSWSASGTCNTQDGAILGAAGQLGGMSEHSRETLNKHKHNICWLISNKDRRTPITNIPNQRIAAFLISRDNLNHAPRPVGVRAALGEPGRRSK
jgi:hypothetical protein